MAAVKQASAVPISFAEALRVWLKIGLLSFGGPAGQIATMHRILVEEKRWIGEARFLHALNYCMLLPGPEATQLATYVGWLLHRTPGGLAAGILFVLPGFAVMLALSILYAGYRHLPLVEAAFFGIKAAVLAVVVEAVLRIGRRALKNAAQTTLAALAFVAIFLFAVPFPLIVLAAGLVGLVGARLRPDLFAAAGGHGPAPDKPVIDALIDENLLTHVDPTPGRAVRMLVVWGALWFAPVLLAALVLGTSHVLVAEGLFFSKTAVVTFGGAYAVLAYVAQQAVENYGWLVPGEMLDGLGLAETTPGPLILVLTFVGYLAALRQAAPLDPLLAGALGAIMTTWVTFVPCFLWIFLGAPYVERLRGNKLAAGALAAITAAVVGVVLNLAVWFALKVVFREHIDWAGAGMRLDLPVGASLDPAALVLAVASMLAMLRLRVGMAWTLAGAALAGLIWRGLL
ncbi:MAG: chromate efflux transporter [Alphaproteobacteria bacterium]|nr:chromate efflux transporter [Alphaproteobacteria bacterium]